MVRAEVEIGDGDGVGAGVEVGFLYGPSVHERGSVLLFGDRVVVRVEYAIVR